jgi:hypothetical protein
MGAATGAELAKKIYGGIDELQADLEPEWPNTTRRGHTRGLLLRQNTSADLSLTLSRSLAKNPSGHR